MRLIKCPPVPEKVKFYQRLSLSHLMELATARNLPLPTKITRKCLAELIYSADLTAKSPSGSAPIPIKRCRQSSSRTAELRSKRIRVEPIPAEFDGDDEYLISELRSMYRRVYGYIPKDMSKTALKARLISYYKATGKIKEYVAKDTDVVVPKPGDEHFPPKIDEKHGLEIYKKLYPKLHPSVVFVQFNCRLKLRRRCSWWVRLVPTTTPCEVTCANCAQMSGSCLSLLHLSRKRFWRLMITMATTI